MEQSRKAPALFILTEFLRVRAHRAFDRQHVLSQRLAGGVFVHQGEGSGSIRQCHRLNNLRRTQHLGSETVSARAMVIMACIAISTPAIPTRSIHGLARSGRLLRYT